jgi:hypothetical protein
MRTEPAAALKAERCVWLALALAVAIASWRQRRKQLQTPAQRWAARLAAAQMGYLVEHQQDNNRQAPKDTVDEAAEQAVDAAVSCALQRARPAFEQQFEPVPRAKCPGCGRVKRWFCNKCLKWLLPTTPPAPLRLPFDLEILVRDEVDNATGIHAAALAQDCKVRLFPDEMIDASTDEDAYDPSSTFVLYPSAEACTAKELAAQSATGGCRPTIIVPDTKWNNDGAVLRHPSLRGLRHVRLQEPPKASAIWRSNARAAAGCVSTIEAIYCFAREWRRALGHDPRPSVDRPGPATGRLSSSSEKEDRDAQLLLLFAVTRYAIDSRANAEQLPPPYADASKKKAIDHRRQKGRPAAAASDAPADAAQPTATAAAQPTAATATATTAATAAATATPPLAHQPKLELPERLVRNIRSREARRDLARTPGLLRWVSLGAADRSAARTLEAVLPPTEAVVNGARGDADEALNRARAAEYAALFKPEKLSPSNNEASLEIIIALLRGLDLQPTDRLLDLGSARGRVVLAAAATTSCALCGGAELSPCDHAAAERARERFGADGRFGGAPPRLFCCDLRDAPLAEFNVFYCAIRGDASRPRVVADLVQRMLAAPLPEGTAPPRRLILAGFGIDVQGTPYEDRVKLVRVYALRRADDDGGDNGEGPGPHRGPQRHGEDMGHGAPHVPSSSSSTEPIAMYGDSQGPRFLLEYLVG